MMITVSSPVKYTRKRGNCESIATWGRPSHASHFPLYFMLWPWPLTPWLWPLILNICSVSSVTCWNYVPNLNAIEQSTAELLRFLCLTVWPCIHVLSVVLGSWIIFTKFDLWQLIRAWIIAFFDADTLYHAVTLTFVCPLDLKLL